MVANAFGHSIEYNTFT